MDGDEKAKPKAKEDTKGKEDLKRIGFELGRQKS